MRGSVARGKRNGKEIEMVATGTLSEVARRTSEAGEDSGRATSDDPVSAFHHIHVMSTLLLFLLLLLLLLRSIAPIY